MLRKVPDRGDIINSLPPHLKDKLFPAHPPPEPLPRKKELWETYWDPSGNPTGVPLPDWPQPYTITDSGFKPAESITDIMSGGSLAQVPTQQPAAAAPQQVTAHTESPWGASISDFFNNDNWTRQYRGINPRSGEPISVGNWYTPGGASAAPTNNQPAVTPSGGRYEDPLKISPFSGPFKPNRFNPGRYPWEYGPGAPEKNIDWMSDLVPGSKYAKEEEVITSGPTPDPAPEEKVKPPWWNQVGEFLGTTWEGAKNLPDYVPNLATSVPITSTLPPETRAAEALNYQHLPSHIQQLLFMQDAGIGRKGPVDRRELGLRRNDLSRLMRRGGMNPRNWGG